MLFHVSISAHTCHGHFSSTYAIFNKSLSLLYMAFLMSLSSVFLCMNRMLLFVLCLLVSNALFVKAAEDLADNSSLCGDSCSPNYPPPPNYIQYKAAPPPTPPPPVQANCPPATVVQCCQYPPPTPFPYTQLPYNNYSASGRVSSSHSVVFGGFVMSFLVNVIWSSSPVGCLFVCIVINYLCNLCYIWLLVETNMFFFLFFFFFVNL